MARRRKRYAPRSTPLRDLLDALNRKPEFREDTLGSGFLQKLHLTRQQRLSLLRWGSLILSCLVALILQDTIFSRFSLFGITTDLPACLILLITVIEGTESGSIFVLLASTFYYFTGSAPGPYAVAGLTVLGLLATMFRQLYWHRNKGSILLCAGLALMGYEIVVFGFSLFSGLTLWSRISRFLGTGLISFLIMILIYPLIHKLGQIGGHTWKE